MTARQVSNLSARVIASEMRRRFENELQPHALLSHLTNSELAQELARRSVQLKHAAWYAPIDDRKDPFIAPAISRGVYAHARRTCYLIGAAAIASQNAQRVRLHHANYGTYNSLCTDEPFTHQPVVVERNAESYGDYGYTGYLIEPDQVLTCWHGWKDFSYEPQIAIFGYAATSGSEYTTELRSENVVPVHLYPAKRPTGLHSTSSVANDWVVLRLERPVTHIKLTLRHRLSAPRVGQAVYTLGYPCGLPLKLADNATVLSESSQEFRANLDTYSGNSGSPVFDALTHDLLGLVVAGQKGQGDFEAVPARKCYVSNRIDHEVTGQVALSSMCFEAAVNKSI